MQPESNATSITHQAICNDSSAYLFGGLNADRQAAFEAHLAHCPACREFVADIVSMIGDCPACDAAVSQQETEHVGLLHLARYLQMSSLQRIEKRRNCIVILFAACLLLLLASSVLSFRMMGIAAARDTLSMEVTALERALDNYETPASGYYVNGMAELHATAEDGIARGMAVKITDGSSEHLLLEAEMLPEPEKQGIYQVWLQRNGNFVHAGKFPIDGGTGAFLYKGELERDSYVAISLEPVSNVGNSPIGPVLLFGSFPS